MIGRIRYTDDDGTVITATLGDDLRWSCGADPLVAAALDVLFGREQYGSTADGFPGPAMLRAAAEAWSAEVIDLRSPADPDDGRLY